jgi:hypothetical protein
MPTFPLILLQNNRVPTLREVTLQVPRELAQWMIITMTLIILL